MSPSPTLAVSGQAALIQQALTYPFQTILDIGAGSGRAALAFHAAGKTVTATGFDATAYRAEAFPAGIDFRADVDVCAMADFADQTFDAVWCAHVLEHTLNPGLALAEIRRVLKPDGRLFLSLPPFKHAVVGGHLTPGWNVGILMQVLAVAGFDVKSGAFVRHGNNIAGFVQRSETFPTGLQGRNGDIERLASHFPPGLQAVQGFDGDLDAVNWSWRVRPSLYRTSLRQRIKRRLGKALRRLL